MSFDDRVNKSRQAAEQQRLREKASRLAQEQKTNQVREAQIRKEESAFAKANEMLQKDPRYAELVKWANKPELRDALKYIWESWKIKEHAYGSKVTEPKSAIHLPQVQVAEMYTRTRLIDVPVFRKWYAGLIFGGNEDWRDGNQIGTRTIVDTQSIPGSEVNFDSDFLNAAKEEALKTGVVIHMCGGEYDAGGNYGGAMDMGLSGEYYPNYKPYLLTAFINYNPEIGRPLFHIGAYTERRDLYHAPVIESKSAHERTRFPISSIRFTNLDSLLDYMAEKIDTIGAGDCRIVYPEDRAAWVY